MAKDTVKWFTRPKGIGLFNRRVGMERMFSFTSRPLKRPA